MNTAIETVDLYYAYGRTPVLKNLTFSVQTGDFFIIIGPNGSGKTTLLKLLSRINRPKTGVLYIFGRLIHRYPGKALARTIAYVSQAPASDFPFTVIEVVMMGRSPHQGMLAMERPSDLEIARESLLFTGIEHLADRKMDQLSGGERQLVFIARAICQQPKIILLDEPTASLDPAHQVRIMDMMERLKSEKGVTVVMVSHEVNLAAMYGNRLLLLREGSIVSLGKPKDVLTFKTLEDAYGCTLLVDESPLGRFPRVTPVPQKFLNS
ncbi:ABC transporter ATP-binding protein [Thermodesulfobacteriota bacterium]